MAERLDFVRATMDDVSDIFDIIDLTGWDETFNDIKQALLNPHNAYLTVVDPDSGEFIGIVLTVNLGKVGFIGHVVVKPEYRNMGIGQELMKEAVSFLSREGCTTIKLDAVPLARTLYERVGFQCEVNSYRYVLPVPSSEVLSARLAKLPQQEQPQISSMKESDFPKVLEIDREIFGANREPFLFTLYEEYPDYAFLASDPSGLIVGYLFGSTHKGILKLRAGISNSQATTVGLIRQALQRFCEEPAVEQIKIGFLETSATAKAAMSFFGFQEQSHSFRMFLGEKSRATTSPSIFAIGDPAKG